MRCLLGVLVLLSRGIISGLQLLQSSELRKVSSRIVVPQCVEVTCALVKTCCMKLDSSITIIVNIRGPISSHIGFDEPSRTEQTLSFSLYLSLPYTYLEARGT